MLVPLVVPNSVLGNHLDLANLWVGKALYGALTCRICKALSVLCWNGGISEGKLFPAMKDAEFLSE
jgi:hypothetical protein